MSAAVTVTNWFGAVFFHLVIPVAVAEREERAVAQIVRLAIRDWIKANQPEAAP